MSKKIFRLASARHKGEGKRKGEEGEERGEEGRAEERGGREEKGEGGRGKRKGWKWGGSLLHGSWGGGGRPWVLQLSAVYSIALPRMQHEIF
jgi:hypothetical protein